MKNSRTAVIVLILVGLLSVPAQAQMIPGRWEKVAALKLGPRITVELKSGDRLEGQFEELSPSGLLLRTGSAQAAIPRADIARITTREADRLRNGVLLGAAIGGAAIGGGVMAEHAIGPASDLNIFGVAMFALAGTALGAAIGLGIDSIAKKEVVLYQAP